MIKLLYRAIAGNKDDHRSLFLRNELRSLLGAGNKNLRTLAYFTLLAFTSVVFAHAGLKYLEMRMDNPFVNWLTFPVSSDMDRDYMIIVDDLKSKSEKRQFTADAQGGFMRYSLGFRDKEGIPTDKVKGRTFIYPDEIVLVEKVLSKDNLIKLNAQSVDPGAWTEQQKKSGIIITEDIVRMIDCKDIKTLHAQFASDYFLSLDVIAVVKSLPDRALFMTSYELYWGLVKSAGKENDIYDAVSTRDRVEFLVNLNDKEPIQSDAVASVNEELHAAGSDVEVRDMKLGELHIASCSFTNTLIFALNDDHEPVRIQEAADIIENSRALAYTHPFTVDRYDLHRLGDLSSSSDEEIRPGGRSNKYSSIAVHFAEIDSIRTFRQYMLNRHGVDISLEQIESRENFHLVTIITSILAIALGLFTLVSIILFITNVLHAHLEKIRMNLGTFMAFGLSREFLIKSYSRLIIGILLFVSLLALVIVGILDVLDLPYRLLTMAGMSLRPDFSDAFTVLSLWLILLIVCILVLTYRNCRKLVTAVLRHYPSDLIYNRTP